MRGTQVVDFSSVGPSDSAVPTWRVVALRELTDLWIGGKALVLLILFSVLLGVMAYLFATNADLRLIPPKETVFLTLQATIAVGLFIGVIIGADSISGERERETLETLLLTPGSRRQIVLGKFLAAISPWPAALAISVPYFVLLAQGNDETWRRALLWGTVWGSLLVPAFAGFGMLVSMWSNSNRTSFFVSLVFYLLCLLPTQFPGTAQKGDLAKLVQRVNPMEAANHFLEKHIVNNRTLEELGPWLLSPIVFLVLVLGLLFWYGAPRLRLEAPRLRREAGKANTVGSSLSRAAGLSAIACLMVSLGTAPAVAFQELTPQSPDLSPQTPVDLTVPQVPERPRKKDPAPPQKMSVDAAASQEPPPPLKISISMDYQAMKTGDQVEFTTTVTNNGREKSPPMMVAMNIINLASGGDPVDPEDWSPQRTQAMEPLAPGQSADQEPWRVNAIYGGKYMVYMVVIPEPAGPQATSRPVASSGIHLTVTEVPRLNPGGVLPLAVGMPSGLALGTVLLLGLRRRRIDTSSSA